LLLVLVTKALTKHFWLPNWQWLLQAIWHAQICIYPRILLHASIWQNRSFCKKIDTKH